MPNYKSPQTNKKKLHYKSELCGKVEKRSVIMASDFCGLCGGRQRAALIESWKWLFWGYFFLSVFFFWRAISAHLDLVKRSNAKPNSARLSTLWQRIRFSLWSWPGLAWVRANKSETKPENALSAAQNLICSQPNSPSKPNEPSIRAKHSSIHLFICGLKVWFVKNHYLICYSPCSLFSLFVYLLLLLFMKMCQCY